MNKIYRVIWNASLQLWQCVSELSRAKGKTKTSKNASSQSLVKRVIIPATLGLSLIPFTVQAVEYSDVNTVPIRTYTIGQFSGTSMTVSYSTMQAGDKLVISSDTSLSGNSPIVFNGTASAPNTIQIASGATVTDTNASEPPNNAQYEKYNLGSQPYATFRASGSKITDLKYLNLNVDGTLNIQGVIVVDMI